MYAVYKWGIYIVEGPKRGPVRGPVREASESKKGCGIFSFVQFSALQLMN